MRNFKQLDESNLSPLQKKQKKIIFTQNILLFLFFYSISLLVNEQTGLEGFDGGGVDYI